MLISKRRFMAKYGVTFSNVNHYIVSARVPMAEKSERMEGLYDEHALVVSMLRDFMTRRDRLYKRAKRWNDRLVSAKSTYLEDENREE